MLRLLLVFSVVACLASCSIYMVEREWTAQGRDGAFTSVGDAASIGKQRAARFPSDLRDCVASQDPAHLKDLDAGKGYRLYGWFLDVEATDRVIACMRPKGWAIVGPAL